MKKLTIGLVVAAVLVLIVGTVAFAQAETPQSPEGWGGNGGRGPGSKGGMMGPGDGTGDMHDLMIESMAAALGISVDELEAQREAGVPLSEVAEALGLSQEEFFEAMNEARAEVMEQAYAEGLLSQEQYEFFLNRGAGTGQYGGGMGHHGGSRGGRGGGGFYGDCQYPDSDS